MRKYVIVAAIILAVCFVSLISLYLHFQPPILVATSADLAKNIPPLILDNFEPGSKHTRNSGTWAKRDGRLFADRVSFNDKNTVLRLTFDVKEDGGKFKEAGWWCSLAGMDMRDYSALRFRVAMSNNSVLFEIGFKNLEWVEQKRWSESFTSRKVPAGQWQEVIIPLKEFHKMDDWIGMDNLSITFRSKMGNIPKGVVYLDDISLIPGPKIPRKPPEPLAEAYPLPEDASRLGDNQLLDLVQRAAFEYFVHESNTANGLVKDFCRVKTKDKMPMTSTAATGFGLASLCVGASRGWISDDVAKTRILATMKFFRNDAESEHGFFYHFLDGETGRRWDESELSSVDTALLLAGMLTAAHYYPGTQIETLAQEIYKNVDWQWMMAGGRTLCMGWKPEEGFLNVRWADYCELMIIYLLALGSPTHPIPADAWYQWGRMLNQFENEKFIACPPLFTHQYSHTFVDFRGMRDEEANYFTNSILATQANRKWCVANAKKFQTYREGFWGLTACDGPSGYMAYGAPYGVDDGTVAPTAAISSIVFTPQESLSAIRLMLEKLGPKVWGRYGFIDAFNLEQKWFSNKYLGIDLGPMVLMIENHRTGLIWKTFMKEPAIQKAMDAAKFKKDQTSSK